MCMSKKRGSYGKRKKFKIKLKAGTIYTIFGFSSIAFGALLFLSFIANGPSMAYLNSTIREYFGPLSFFLPIVFILFGLHVTDIDCGFKLINKKVVDTIPKLEAERGAFISSEFLIKSKKAGFKIAEVGVHHYPRVEGQATGRNIKVIIKSFSDLFRLWFKTNFRHV